MDQTDVVQMLTVRTYLVITPANANQVIVFFFDF